MLSSILKSSRKGVFKHSVNFSLSNKVALFLIKLRISVNLVKFLTKLLNTEHRLEAAVRRCFSKYMFLKISQYLRKNTRVGVSF